MILWLTCLLLQNPTSEGDVVNPPDQEITTQRVEALSAQMKKIVRVQEHLKTLGGPTEIFKGESPEDALKRVERIFKGRAYLMVLLSEEYQNALSARYELEALLQEFKRWTEESEKDQKREAISFEEQTSRVKKSLELLQNELKVVAYLLHKRLKVQEEKTGDPSFKSQIDVLSNTASLFDTVTDREVLVKKFEKISDDIPAMSKELDLLRRKINDARIELDTVQKTQRVLTSTVFEDLGPGRCKALKEAEELLKQTGKLEDQAALLAITAKYTREVLARLDTPGQDPANRIRALRAQLVREQQMSSALGAVSGEIGLIPLGENQKLEDLVQDKPTKPTVAPMPAVVPAPVDEPAPKP